MPQWLKVSTAVDIKYGPFIDDTDGKTAETGLTTARTYVYLSKNGGALTQKNETTALSHDLIGYYVLKLDGTDTNTLGRLRIAMHLAGSLPVWQDFMVVTADAWDSFFAAVVIGQAGAQAALVTNNLDHLAKTATAAADMTAEVVDDSILSRVLANGDTSTFVQATDGLRPVATNVAAIHTHVDAFGTTDNIADAVWDEVTSGHAAAGTAGKALTDAASAGDPWNTSLPGAYGAGKAGKLVGDNLNAPVDAVDTVVDAIKVVVDDLHDTDLPAVKSDTAAVLTAVDTEVAALGSELAKVPKSDAAVTWNATALASVNAEVDTALNTAIPGSPTADSINERIVTLDGHVGADYGTTEKTCIDLLDDAAGGLADIHTDVGTAISQTTAASIATAVWGALVASYNTVLTFGKYLGGAPAGATIAADIADIHTDVADVHTDVGTAITNVGDVHATDLPAVKAVVDVLKVIIAHKSVENAGSTLVTYKAAGGATDAGTQAWDEATKTRGEYAAS